ncbi:uncharacterized protein CIMG_09381 [Coccidioides immitis RS]|uniref:DUF614 domain-containing protein n=3 Tax=Coccidioides immitis TaxID=5501 RepID=A0A0E1S0E1_COCIM|nr:uncharacterized protein CIMG_09381 [Coccidioides immitis RS]EAS28177.1 hypothetical protein CIMG_09381 [Coccidioides immitis RS]KMP09005.1 hypothetical protein CIRG_08686 [Coccidioides immitis RMSCC 2394]KMU85804.1 hypothetical protein CIHG_03332 [Coccidioides immitis H538.4]TPX20835.1 hypothetical protein DIZ76_016731 [Coccidioides immitis]
MSNLHLQPVNERQGRRYSYLNTPAEYQAPTFPPRNPEKPDNAVGPPIQSDRVSSPGPQNPYAFSYTVTGAISPPPQTTAHTVPYIQPQMNPTPPPLSEHPARFAPYADSPTSPTRQTQQPEQPQRLQYYSPSPASPGPIPPKQMLQPDMQQQRPPQKEYSVAPDSNPLAPPDPALTPKPSSISAAGSQLGTRTTARDLNHAPGQVLHPRQEVRGGTWSYALCDCRDIGVCCTGLFCPCILYGRTQYRLSRKSDQKDPTNLLGYETCNAQCTAMGLLCGCQWLLATIQHIRVRRAYGISSDIATDCVRASCCTCCTLIQDEREIKYREEAARLTGGVPGSTVPAYTTPGQMIFSPPPR